MVFICEGQSAAGSITSCRDVNNQAVFVLKGKPLNVWDLKRDVMYKNDEMYNLMQALNVEDNTEGLRYDKVILATDADVDGMHIRNLMITYFFKFFEQLVHDGHVYVLETPLFRVRNKEKTIYCYSEAERDAAPRRNWAASRRSRGSKAWAKSARRNFSNSSAKRCGLSKVEYAPRAESGPIFNFYMGKNTPERKDYIMDSLVVPVEAAPKRLLLPSAGLNLAVGKSLLSVAVTALAVAGFNLPDGKSRLPVARLVLQTA
jgi:topoisomerase-4 subunit B